MACSYSVNRLCCPAVVDRDRLSVVVPTVCGQLVQTPDSRFQHVQTCDSCFQSVQLIVG